MRSNVIYVTSCLLLKVASAKEHKRDIDNAMKSSQLDIDVTKAVEIALTKLKDARKNGV